LCGEGLQEWRAGVREAALYGGGLRGEGGAAERDGGEEVEGLRGGGEGVRGVCGLCGDVEAGERHGGREREAVDGVGGEGAELGRVSNGDG
jgi:hypothetical protein